MSEAGPLKLTTATWIAGSFASTVTPGPVAAGGVGIAAAWVVGAGLAATGAAVAAEVAGFVATAVALLLSLLLEPQPRAKSEVAARGTLPVTSRARRRSSRLSMRRAW